MRYVTESEIVVFTRAVTGDTEAFGHLVNQYSNAVYATAFQVVKDFHRSEEIAQETFIRAWHNLGRIREVDKFGSWLHTTAKRISIDFLRKENKYRLTTLDDLEHRFQVESTEDIALRNERQTLVWQAISQLTDKERNVIILYYMSGFDTREIASFLNVSNNTVESRLRRTREKLKKELFDMTVDIISANKLGEAFREKVVSKIARICFTYIPVTDVRRSVAWYEEVLGFKPDLVFDTHAILQPDLQLLRTDAPVVQNMVEGKALPRTAYFSDDINGYHKYLNEQGVRTEEIIEEGECGWHFELYDPDGNRITIWQARY
jgi:RNA polymerase sigma factor (sigma-70 family)